MWVRLCRKPITRTLKTNTASTISTVLAETSAYCLLPSAFLGARRVDALQRDIKIESQVRHHVVVRLGATSRGKRHISKICERRRGRKVGCPPALNSSQRVACRIGLAGIRTRGHE